MSKTPHSELDYMHSVIDLRKIDPCPYQHRRHFAEDKLKELAASIQGEGLIEPIEAIVEILDAELIEDIEYLSMGATPAKR